MVKLACAVGCNVCIEANKDNQLQLRPSISSNNGLSVPNQTNEELEHAEAKNFIHSNNSNNLFPETASANDENYALAA